MAAMVDCVARLQSREQRTQIGVRPEMTVAELIQAAAAKFNTDTKSIAVTLTSPKGEMAYMLGETDFELTLVGYCAAC